MRLLKRIQIKNKGKEFSFELSSKDIYLAELERKETTEDSVNKIINHEILNDIPIIDNTYSSAFKFLYWINQKGKGKVEKMFSIAPLSCLKPVYIRIDNLGLQMLNNGKKMPYLHLLNEKANKICKSKVIGRSLQMDGTQAIMQYIQVVTLKLRGDKKADEWNKKEALRWSKFREWQINGKAEGKSRPRFPALKESRQLPSNKPFIGEKCGLFRQERTDTPRYTADPLPKVIGIDPGQKNLWSACLYNSDVSTDDNDQDEAIPIFTLKRTEYNQGIGLFRLRKWQKKKTQGKKL